MKIMCSLTQPQLKVNTCLFVYRGWKPSRAYGWHSR